MVLSNKKADLKYALMEFGEQSVTIHGAKLMLMYFAMDWAMMDHVSPCNILAPNTLQY